MKYGEVWTCRCGRRWNTAQIDRADYDALRRVQLKYRILPVALGLATSLLALFFVLTHNFFSLVVLLPMALIGWGVLLRPGHRRRYREAIADLPKWSLRAE